MPLQRRLYLSEQNLEANLKDVVECIDGRMCSTPAYWLFAGLSSDNPARCTFRLFAYRAFLHYQVKAPGYRRPGKRIEREEQKI